MRCSHIRAKFPVDLGAINAGCSVGTGSLVARGIGTELQMLAASLTNGVILVLLLVPSSVTDFSGLRGAEGSVRRRKRVNTHMVLAEWLACMCSQVHAPVPSSTDLLVKSNIQVLFNKNTVCPMV